ncbi:Cytochrome P450 [Quillaja saponaria]|uniref:Cytochrome P450 n=1 Tax=Quillaja saponaria TaxID=32244 RepID=A0AAD7PPQ1_QUISA|nr:Cytochrome P450 [Quillaja saponaria]
MAFRIVKRSTRNLPPGPRKLPLIGNMHQLIGALPHESLRNLAKKYGPLMHLQLGELSTIIVSSPEIAKEVMKTHDVIFASRPYHLASSITAYDSTNITFSPYGSYWRQLRKICLLELLTQKRVQSFQFIREEEVSSLINTIASHEGSVINLSDMVSSLTNGIISRAAFGKKTRDGQAFVSTLETAIQLAAGFCIADLYPSIKVLQVITGIKPKLEKIHKKFDKILDNIIKDYKESKLMNNSSTGEAEENLLGVLLKFQAKKDPELPLTDNNVKAVILDIFGAGTETSSTTVVWAMSEILKNLIVMEEAQAETRVIINALAIGRDPKYWTDAEKFKPERFLDSPIDYRGTNFEFIPFGAGRRMCPGITFGMANVELPLAKLLYHFDWKLPNGMKPEDFDMSESEVTGVTLKRNDDLCQVGIGKEGYESELSSYLH